MTNELVEVKQEIMVPPERAIAEAKGAAQALMSVVSQKKKPVIVNGEQFLEFEDWQTVAHFYGCTVDTGQSEYVEINGIAGARAKARLIDSRTGLVIGGAEAVVLRDEENWQTKPWFQLASMAQTRAGSKAFRNAFSWVVVLAGYRPTPAEEVVESLGGTGVKSQIDTTNHYCAVHGVNFFKRGKMRQFAHPIGDTKEWCNESDQLETSADATKPPETAHDASGKVIEQGKPTRGEQLTALSDHIKGTGKTQAAWLKEHAFMVVAVTGLGDAEELPRAMKAMQDEKAKGLQ